MASTGFGNGIAVPPTGGSSGATRLGKGWRLLGSSKRSRCAQAKQSEEAPAVQPVSIISKPNPVYSDEARKLGIEGDVLVDVVFLASGTVQVNHVVKGLGHGTR